MLDKSVDPSRLCGSWASHAQPLIHTLDCPRSVIVKLPVASLLWLSAPEIEIRFVPDFKVPLRNFVDAVAFNQMLGECGDKVVPFAPVLWRRDVRPVPENVQKVVSR